MLLEETVQMSALTALERIGPKGYLRYVFPFELPDNYDLDEVSRVLTSGYEGLIKRIPTVGCEAVVDSSSKQAGVLKMQRLDEEDRHIVVKDLRAPGAFPMHYAELKTKHFPVSAFDGNTLLRRSVWPRPGEELPVSMAQANFVPGGLILTWCILHMMGDGNTFYTWTKVWADECRRRAAGDYEMVTPLQLDPAIFDDRKLVMRSSGRHKGRLEDHPEYTLIPFTPQGPPPKMASPDHRGQVFYFSPAALAALKAEAWPDRATQPTSERWISTNDALSALLWRTVIAVQSPLAGLEGDPLSVFNIAIDGRLRTDPPVHPNTLGCFLEYVAVSAPIRAMLSTMNLADLAVLVRKAVRRANKHFTGDVISLVDQLEDVDRLVPTAFLDVPGNHCVQSSWANFELYGLDWGSTLGKIQSVRAPDVGVINGLQIALPPLPDGGLEILVGVETNALYRLLHEPLWTKFAKAR